MVDQQVQTNAFSEEGRLLQAEYAIKGVKEAGTIIGLVCTNGVILLGINPTKASSLEKIYQINKNSFVAVSGIFSDALRLIKFARLESCTIKEKIGFIPKVSVLTELMSAEMQYYTQIVSARPFGVCLLYSGYEEDEYVLYSTDPSGTVNRWKAICYGSDDESINSLLRNEIKDTEISVDQGLHILFKIILKAREWNKNFYENIEVLVHNHEGPKILSVSELKELSDSVLQENTQ